MTDGAGYDASSIEVLFDFPLNGRNEVVMAIDVARAMISAIKLYEEDKAQICNETFFVGGGSKNGCQIYNRDLVSGLFDAMGIGLLDEKCFIDNCDKYFMDWYDTSKSQKLLQYQNHSFEYYKNQLYEQSKKARPVMKLVSKPLKRMFYKMSPYTSSDN